MQLTHLLRTESAEIAGRESLQRTRIEVPYVVCAEDVEQATENGAIWHFNLSSLQLSDIQKFINHIRTQRAELNLRHFSRVEFVSHSINNEIIAGQLNKYTNTQIAELCGRQVRLGKLAARGVGFSQVLQFQTGTRQMLELLDAQTSDLRSRQFVDLGGI